MRSLVCYIIFCFFSISANAQEVKNAWAYGGFGNEYATQNCIDHLGNRYTSIAFNEHNFIIDSLGSPIIITRNPNAGQGNFTIAIVKYNPNGDYLHHIKLNTSSGNSNNSTLVNLNLNITSTNDLIINYRFRANDSANLIDSKGVLFKKVRANTPRVHPQANKYFAHFICKVNPNGQFIWVNTIVNEGIWKNLPVRPTFGSTITNLTITNNDNVKIVIDNDRSPTDSSNDTLTVTNTIGLKSQIIINSKCVLINFNSNGLLLSQFEILKGRIEKNKLDTMIRFDYFIQTDGVNTYNLFAVYVNEPDTFICNTPIPLKIGYNFLLFKLDSAYNIIWGRAIANTQRITGTSILRAKVCFDNKNKELIVGLNFVSVNFELNDTNVKMVQNTNAWQVYYSRIDSDGVITYSNLMVGSAWGDFLSRFIYNPIFNQLYAIVLARSPGNNTFKIGNEIFSTTEPAELLLTFDSLNNLIALKKFQDKNATLAGIWGEKVIDPAGNLYLAGYFTDSSAQFDCKKIYASEFNGTNAEAMVIKLGPLKPIYLQACKGVNSPSGKYYWDSSGYYFDTLTNTLGCDSFITAYVRIVENKSKIDSTVCQGIQSISGKYFWDSSGTYLDTIPNSFNCDSVITVNLKILPRYFSIDTAVNVFYTSPSARYTWDSSGVYSDTLQNTFGCDSILLINLRVLQSYGSIDTSVCFAYTSPSLKYLYTQSGFYRDTIPNAFGADSIISISVKILQSYSTLDTSNCGPINSLSGKYLYTQSGQYVDTIPNSLFCDSVVTINYTRTPTKDTIYISSCTPYAGVSGKLAVFSDGLYLDTLTSTLGCDSILYVFFSSLNTSSTIQIKSCDSVVSPSKKYVFRQSGLYQDTLKNQFNCDSIITIQLSVEPLNIAVSKSNNITCDSPFAQLEVTGGTIFKWWPETGLNNHQIFNPIANPENNIWYYVLVRTEIGCEASDSIKLLVNKDPEEQEIANVFTPNNDGINDCFPIEGIAKFIEVEIEIFNRWGATLFKSNNPKACWDGYAPNGQKASEGTYFYVLSGKSTCHQNVQLHGTISLIR